MIYRALLCITCGVPVHYLWSTVVHYLWTFSNTYTDLLKKMNTVSLSDKRIQTMLVMVYKCLSGLAPAYIRSFFHERDSVYNLRGARKLYVPRSRTTTFGLHSCKHLATTAWNKLPDHVRTAETVTAFRSKIKNFIM